MESAEVQRRLQQLVAYLRTVVGPEDALLKALLKRVADESTGPVADTSGDERSAPGLKGRLPGIANAR